MKRRTCHDMNTQLKTALLFQNHMVLQRRKPICIWGTGPTGKQVKVTFRNVTVSTLIKNGNWIVWLPPMEAGIGDAMSIACEKSIITLKEISVGEVWLAGGQSNMEFLLKYDVGYTQALSDGENRQIYFFDYPEVSYEGQLAKQNYSYAGFWRPCKGEHLKYYSAVAYYFAQKLQKKYQIPIGIIGCNWGGTTASCWMSKEFLENTPGSVWLNEYENEIKALNLTAYDKNFEHSPFSYVQDPCIHPNPINDQLLTGLTKEEMIKAFQSDSFQQPLPEIGPKSPWRPCGLYHSMLKQIAPYSISGVIWYQGESDDIHAEVYDSVLSQMIQCWRTLWKEELPFLLCQLAPLGLWFPGSYHRYSEIREKQELVADTVSQTWLTTTGDAGLEWDIHPKNKRPIGERLALLAMGHIYQENILCDPPRCTATSIKDGNLYLFFDNVGSHFLLHGKNINTLTLFCDGKKVDYIFRLTQNIIILENPRICQAHTVEIQFGIGNYFEINLYNEAEIPVRPFKITIR